MDQKSISIIIPAYNEEGSILQVLNYLKEYLKNQSFLYEIIIVNDGSKDKTGDLVREVEGIKLISHPYNKGYGAALKTGIRNSKFNWLLFFDSDGQHDPKYIPQFLEYMNQYDLITGARITGYKGSLFRQLGKKILLVVARYLVNKKIPDLNCGFRLAKKEYINKILHFLPNSFSFSTTTTIAFYKEGFNVKFVPIEMKERIGRSTVKSRDAFRTLMFIIRVILLFSPLRFFLPFFFILFLSGLISLIYDIIRVNITDTTLLLITSSLIVFFFGLLSDQLAAIRRELK